MRHWLRSVREWFWLGEAQRLAEGCTDDARGEVRVLATGVNARAKMAREAADEHFDPVAIVLYGQALRLATTAALVGRGTRPAGTALGSAELMQLIDSGELPALGPAADYAELRVVFVADDASVTDRLSPTERTRSVDLLTAALRRVRKLYEVRTRRRIRVLRWLRLAALALAFAGTLAAAALWLFLPQNLARGRPVTASSMWPGTPPPAGLVDGSVTDTFGAHTEIDGKAWFTIDLGKPHRLSRVVVYNRGDGYFADMLPLVVELSLDARSFDRAASRDGTFTHKQPWTAILKGETARYVRVRVDRKNAYIALGEVEIYGRPAR